LVCLLALACAPLRAQQDDTGGGEVTGFLGGVFGVGSHVGGGFGFASPTSRHLVPNIEFAYTPLGNTNFLNGLFDHTINVVSSRLYDLNGGVQVRFPMRSTNYAPYFGLGVGLLRFTTDQQVAAASPVTLHSSKNYFAGNCSVGMRYYITSHLGLRPEIKGYFGHKSFARVAVGIFYQFP
jgi:hypothetical protein